jgi:hypothetical protein
MLGFCSREFSRFFVYSKNEKSDMHSSRIQKTTAPDLGIATQKHNHTPNRKFQGKSLEQKRSQTPEASQTISHGSKSQIVGKSQIAAEWQITDS